MTQIKEITINNTLLTEFLASQNMDDLITVLDILGEDLGWANMLKSYVEGIVLNEVDHAEVISYFEGLAGVPINDWLDFEDELDRLDPIYVDWNIDTIYLIMALSMAIRNEMLNDSLRRLYVIEQTDGPYQVTFTSSGDEGLETFTIPITYDQISKE